MKLAFLYGAFSLGNRPIDFDALDTAPRGLTGSESSCIEYAVGMAARGHDVSLLVGQRVEPREWRGVKLLSLDDPKLVRGSDAVLSWNEPNLLMDVEPGPLRVVNQQLNDFGYCRPGWADACDLVTSPSEHHLAFLRTQAPDVRTWAVVPNGCDPDAYDVGRGRVPGRVLWASSADRGLHLLLEAWPEVKARVPNASLRAFYNFPASEADDFETPTPIIRPDLLEISQRKRYIRHAVAKLADPRWDVEHVGSASRERMRAEFSKSVVLGYPCSTIRYTEGFSVTTLEACASGCLPVITDIDSLGHIYGGAAPMVRLDGGALTPEKMPEYVDLLVRGLTDEAWRSEHVAKCRALAAEHSWARLSERLEDVLKSRLRERPTKADGKKKSRQERKAQEASR